MTHSPYLDRDEVIASFSQLPKRVSAKSLFYRLHVLSSIQAGLNDIKAGRIIPQAEIEERFKRKRLLRSTASKKTSSRSSNRQKPL